MTGHCAIRIYYVNSCRYLSRQNVDRRANNSESKYSDYTDGARARAATNSRSRAAEQDDGAVADLQCLLANALLQDGDDVNKVVGYRL